MRAGPARWPRRGRDARCNGVSRDRTGGIQIFSLALSQLSYHPGKTDIRAEPEPISATGRSYLNGMFGGFHRRRET